MVDPEIYMALRMKIFVVLGGLPAIFEPKQFKYVSQMSILSYHKREIP